MYASKTRPRLILVLTSHVKLYDLLLTTQEFPFFFTFCISLCTLAMYIGYVLYLPIYEFYAAMHKIFYLLRYHFAVSFSFLIFTFHPSL